MQELEEMLAELAVTYHRKRDPNSGSPTLSTTTINSRCHEETEASSELRGYIVTEWVCI
jgi:hypothetical protein